MKLSNVSLHNYGCSDSEGTLVFNENILDESSTFENVNSNSKWLMKKKPGLYSMRDVLNFK